MAEEILAEALQGGVLTATAVQFFRSQQTQAARRLQAATSVLVASRRLQGSSEDLNKLADAEESQTLSVSTPESGSERSGDRAEAKRTVESRLAALDLESLSVSRDEEVEEQQEVRPMTFLTRFHDENTAAETAGLGVAGSQLGQEAGLSFSASGFQLAGDSVRRAAGGGSLLTLLRVYSGLPADQSSGDHHSSSSSFFSRRDK